eukprot:jgi/Psemu1/51032/gm1.51032_g
MVSTNPATANSSRKPVRATAAMQEEQEKLLKDAMLALTAFAGAMLLLKALAASIAVYVALLPLVYIYGIQTCPPASSFDAKQQLRAVLRGDALPPDHPDKPKGGMLAQFLADAKATITSELATLPGYEVTITSIAGAALVATVTMPTTDLECCWVGCNHRWYYWGSRRLSEANQDSVAVAGVSNNREGRNVYEVPESFDIKIGKTRIKLD